MAEETVMDIERLFQAIAEIAGERYGATVKVKEVRDKKNYPEGNCGPDDFRLHELLGEPDERS